MKKRGAAKRGRHHPSSQIEPAAGLSSAGSGVPGAVRALTGDELRQKKIQRGSGSPPALGEPKAEEHCGGRAESNSRHFQDGAL